MLKLMAGGGGRIMVELQKVAVLMLFTASASPGQTAQTAPAQDDSTTRVQVAISGGHETDPRDRGRPVVLIASALGVPPTVFREVFSHVRPAPAGTAPDPEQVRRNKAALLAALSRCGVTNESLDQVSNYYRYNRSRGEMWPTVPAIAHALVKDGKVICFVVTNGGSGYSSPPAITVPGVKGTVAIPQLYFSRWSRNNGSIYSISVGSGK